MSGGDADITPLGAIRGIRGNLRGNCTGPPVDRWDRSDGSDADIDKHAAANRRVGMSLSGMIRPVQRFRLLGSRADLLSAVLYGIHRAGGCGYRAAARSEMRDRLEQRLRGCDLHIDLSASPIRPAEMQGSGMAACINAA